MPWLWLSVAEPLRELLPLEATVAGLAPALTERVWAEGCTVSVVLPLLLMAPGPTQVAVTVSVTLRSLSVLFAGAV